MVLSGKVVSATTFMTNGAKIRILVVDDVANHHNIIICLTGIWIGVSDLGRDGIGFFSPFHFFW